MKIKNHLMELEEKLDKAKGQDKVKLHEEMCGREYNENNER